MSTATEREIENIVTRHVYDLGGRMFFVNLWETAPDAGQWRIALEHRDLPDVWVLAEFLVSCEADVKHLFCPGSQDAQTFFWAVVADVDGEGIEETHWHSFMAASIAAISEADYQLAALVDGMAQDMTANRQRPPHELKEVECLTEEELAHAGRIYTGHWQVGDTCCD